MYLQTHLTEGTSDSNGSLYFVADTIAFLVVASMRLLRSMLMQMRWSITVMLA